MKLSKRLQTIANMIPPNMRVIDVGCDHALLDVYLTLQGMNECVASDINENVLEKTKEMISKYQLSNQILIQKSDGLKEIDLKDDDVVVIAGMGTSTILSIIEQKGPKHLIVQSNNDLKELRVGFSEKGYFIVEEQVVLEKGIYYVIIQFEKGFSSYTEKEYLFGPILIWKRDGKTNCYFKELLDKKKRIYANLPASNAQKKKFLLEIRYLEEIIGKSFLEFEV